MPITKNEINELNDFLESENIDIEGFNKLYQSIKHNNTVKIKLIDFEYYNEKRLEEARKEKINCVQVQEFEKAAFNRQLEMDCRKHVELKTEFKIEKSAFYYEQNYLMYFYFGTAKNDKLIRKALVSG